MNNFTAAQQSPVNSFTNFRIFPSSQVSQTETDIARHPLNPNILFASAITINRTSAFISEGVYVSTNAGSNWFGSDTCFGLPLYNHGGDPGPMIDKDGNFFLSHIGSFISGMYVHKSTNNGKNWSNAYTLESGIMDKGDIATDDVSGSSYYGNTYISFVIFEPPYYVNFTATSNGGTSWTSYVHVNNPPQRCQGAEIRIGLNGKIFICWAGTINSSPFTEVYTGLAISSNGGQNWNTRESIYNTNGIMGILSQKSNIRVNGLPRMEIDKSGGPRNGWIYIITTEKNLSPAGNDPDIIMHKSTDQGLNWSAGIRVNQDAINNGKIQYFPAINIDDNGGINVIYYDDRNTTSDSASLFLSRSTDGGNTFSDYEISSQRFEPSPIAGIGAGYQGDNIGLTSAGNYLYALWMDNRTGVYQAWIAKIDINSIGIRKIASEIPDAFELHQNYPNPFNPSTVIRYSVNKKSLVTLRVYDITGKEVSILVNEIQEPAVYEIMFDGSNSASGIYFYSLTSETDITVRKMILGK